MRWRHGDEVLWREIWRGWTYAEFPVRVVHDDDRQIAVYLAEGTQFVFPAGGWPFEGDIHGPIKADGPDTECSLFTTPGPGTRAVALLDRCGSTVRRLVSESPGPIQT